LQKRPPPVTTTMTDRVPHPGLHSLRHPNSP
jgi:hypothetical protein